MTQFNFTLHVSFSLSHSEQITTTSASRMTTTTTGKKEEKINQLIIHSLILLRSHINFSLDAQRARLLS
jgi:hypothetical protein